MPERTRIVLKSGACFEVGTPAEIVRRNVQAATTKHPGPGNLFLHLDGFTVNANEIAAVHPLPPVAPPPALPPADPLRIAPARPAGLMVFRGSMPLAGPFGGRHDPKLAEYVGGEILLHPDRYGVVVEPGCERPA